VAKRDLGPAGPGRVYDHVVEQSQIGRSGFAPTDIHNPFNPNPVTAATNQLNANYYSRIRPFTGVQTVRGWLGGQSFADQYKLWYGYPVPDREREAIAMIEPAVRVDELRNQYRDLVLAWEAERDDPKKANKIFKRHHAFYKSIRDSAEGREAIVGLMGDPATAVRLMAATHSLRWLPERAESVLDDIEKEMSFYGADAKYTLQGHRKGTLDLEW